MPLIFEIAAGIVLGVAIIALAIAFWERLAIGLALGVGIAVATGGGAILYGICDSWESVALVILLLGTIGGAMVLIELFNAHEKYGPSFRAVGDSISAGVIFSTSATLIIWLPIAILSESRMHRPYQIFLIPLAIVTFDLSALFFYKRRRQKEWVAVPKQSA